MVKFTVSLRSERGHLIEEEGAEVIHDDKGLLDSLLPYNDSSYLCLSYIDRQGLTIFADYQMQGHIERWKDKGFIPECQRLRSRSFSPRADDLLARIELLAYQCQHHVHVKLWFEAKSS